MQASTRRHTRSSKAGLLDFAAAAAAAAAPHTFPQQTTMPCFCLPGRSPGLLLPLSPGTAPCPTIHLWPRGARIVSLCLFCPSLPSVCKAQSALSGCGSSGCLKGFLTSGVALREIGWNRSVNSQHHVSFIRNILSFSGKTSPGAGHTVVPFTFLSNSSFEDPPTLCHEPFCLMFCTVFHPYHTIICSLSALDTVTQILCLRELRTSHALGYIKVVCVCVKERDEDHLCNDHNKPGPNRNHKEMKEVLTSPSLRSDVVFVTSVVDPGCRLCVGSVGTVGFFLFVLFQLVCRA